MSENKLQYPVIPENTKTVIHILSILLFPVILTAFGYFKTEYPEFGVIVFGFLIYVALATFFYYLAGGFDWKPEKLSTLRGLLFFVLSGIIYGLLLYGYWYLVRFFVAKTSKLPFSDIKGKLLTRK